MAQTHELVRRLLDSADVARVVPRLPPEVLHRVIERCGLEACADLVLLTTPKQLERLLDIDLWRAPVPGADETFDAGRFAAWLDVLLDMDADLAADRLAAMDLDLVVGGLTEHVAVFDGAAAGPFTTLDGELMPGRVASGPAADVGGFVVEGKQSPAWQAIVEVLGHLHGVRPALFSRVMRGCVALSDGAREADGFHGLLDRHDQHRADLAAGREARRDSQGYVAPAQARGFLQAARRIDLAGERPALDPIAHACLRDVAPAPIVEEGAVTGDPAVTADAAAEVQAVATVMEILSDAGVVPPPRALLGSGDEDTRLALVHAFASTHPRASEEVAFLVNAIVGGCAIQDRPFTPPEASDAVLATCNLGLEHWPDRWADRDLVTAFEVGWTMVHRDLSQTAAAALIEVLASLHCHDRETEWSLQTLRRELIRHSESGEPWRARPALDALLALDSTAWAVLRALLDECPSLHATLTSSGRRLRIDPADVRFVARASDIATVRDYLTSLQSALAS